MGYICKSDNPDYELVDLIRKTFIPGEYMLVMLVDDQIIIYAAWIPGILNLLFGNMIFMRENDI